MFVRHFYSIRIHTLIAVVFARWNLYFFFKLENNTKFQPANATFIWYAVNPASSLYFRESLQNMIDWKSGPKSQQQLYENPQSVRKFKMLGSICKFPTSRSEAGV